MPRKPRAVTPAAGPGAPDLPEAVPPFTHALTVPAESGTEPDSLSLPAGPGVALFESPAGGTVLIATTANLRELARRRLGPEPEGAPDAPRSRRVDHRSVTARVLAVRCGSAFECDAVYLHYARERLPAVYRAAVERWRGWFVHVDPAAPFPQFTKTTLTGPVAPRSASTPVRDSGEPGQLLGPFPDKDAAGRFIEQVTDAFDLCRFHNLLVQAPAAAACAYKEMGRCPAPCDGSEPLEPYRARVAHAAACAARIGSAVASLETAMREAAARQEFETAAGLHARLKRLEKLSQVAFQHVRPLESFKWLVTQASPRQGWARVFAVVGGRLAWICDAQPAAAAEVADRIGPVFQGPAPFGFTAPEIDTVGLVCRWIFLAKRKRPGAFVALDGAPDAAAVRAALAAALRQGDGEAGVAESEMEGA